MAATDAKIIPVRNVAYRLYFDIRDAAGALITTWADMDTELASDGGAFSDATNEATEIGTSGVGFIDLDAGEMDFDSVIVKVAVSNAGAIPVVIYLYPQEEGDILVETQSVTDEAIGPGAIAVDAIDGDALSLTALLEIENQIFDVAEMETDITLREAMKVLLAVLAGKVSGGPDAPVFRDINDTKDRLTVAATSVGNRTSVTVDVT